MARPVWMPVPAWPETPGVTDNPAPTRPAVTNHHARSGCSAAGRRFTSNRTSGNATASSASRTSATLP